MPLKLLNFSFQRFSTVSYTLKARSDIKSCLIWSIHFFGEEAAQRYKKLIEMAIREIAETPGLIGSREVPGMPDVFLYHFRWSRKRAAIDGVVVQNPRHMLVYKINSPSELILLRVLHDQRDLEARMSESSN